MNTPTKIAAFILFSLPLLAGAAGKTASATMQVTFEVKESCTVQSAAGTAPAVTCQLNTPYQAQAQAAAAPAAASDNRAAADRQPAADGVWTITF